MNNNIVFKKLIIVTIILLISFVAYSENDINQTTQDKFVKDLLFISPNPKADKRRLEAGDAEGVNRGVRVRGVRVRGVRVRGVRVRGNSNGTISSGGLTDELEGLLDIKPEKNEAQETNEVSFPSRLAPIATEQTGFSANNQPTLYWYISSACNGPMEFKIMNH